MTEPIFHIAVPDDWEAARATGRYERSTRGRSLVDEGFVHCSYGAQVASTANRFYGDLEVIVLLEIDPARTPADLEALLKASPSRAADSGLPVPVLTIGMEMRKQ